MRLTTGDIHWFVSVDLENSDRVLEDSLTATRDEYLARATQDACANEALWARSHEILVLTATSFASKAAAEAFAAALERTTGVPMKVERAVSLVQPSRGPSRRRLRLKGGRASTRGEGPRAAAQDPARLPN
ncbi:hypothetical protein WDZ92_31355 [Nostoc sp. NIES-2111]